MLWYIIFVDIWTKQEVDRPLSSKVWDCQQGVCLASGQQYLSSNMRMLYFVLIIGLSFNFLISVVSEK